MSVLDQTLDYQSKQLENSSYTHMKIVRQSGSQSANAGDDLQFEIPVQAVNLGRSYLTYDITTTVTGGASTDYIWHHEGIVPFQSVQLFTRGGQYLCDIRDDATMYSRIVGSIDSTDTELEEGSGHPEQNAAAAPVDIVEPLHPSSGSERYVGYSATQSTDKPYWEQRYLSRGPATDGSATFTQKKLLPLKFLKDTIFEVDKSILFREVIVLKVKLAAKEKLAYTARDDSNTAAASAAISSVAFSNINLYVAQERNASVVEALNAQTNSQEGFSLLVPFPSLYTNNINNSNKHNITIRLNKYHGSSLKKIQSVCAVQADNNSDAYNFENIANDKVQDYYTNINNNRLTEFNVVSADNLDWMTHKKRCKGTPIYNAKIYKRNWFIEDEFSNCADKMSDMKTKDTNVYSGIDLNEEIRYDIYATMASSLSRKWFSLIHGQKVLNINQSGLIIG